MKQQKTTENYLKAIYLGVSRPTVSVSLRSLEKEGYLYLDGSHKVHLTESGRALAQNIYEKTRRFGTC